MSLTVFLARFLGAYMLALVVWMALRKPQVIAILRPMVVDPAHIFWIAVLRIGMGLAMVIGHDVWRGGALPVVVTLIGWTTLLRGLFMLYAPEKVPALYDRMGFEAHYAAYVGVSALLALYLLIASYLG